MRHGCSLMCDFLIQCNTGLVQTEDFDTEITHTVRMPHGHEDGHEGDASRAEASIKPAEAKTESWNSF